MIDIDMLEKQIQETFDKKRTEQESLIIKELIMNDLEKAARLTCEEDS